MPHSTVVRAQNGNLKTLIYSRTATPKTKPVVLLVLAGAHHLDLYKSVLAECLDFDWVVYIKDIHSVPDSQIRWANIRFGTQFFSDKATALAHFGAIDAVVTTFAVPHMAHLHYLDFVALAYEMGLPVFEMQHGMFQIGFNIQEKSALVGSGKRAERNSLPGPNLVAENFTGLVRTQSDIPPTAPLTTRISDI